MADSKLLQRLSATPVQGVSMAGVSLLRLDLTGGPAPGNKVFKLGGNLARARELGINRLLSFGGAWSNHLHALAAVGRDCGFETVGIVRGEESVSPSAMLRDAYSWGMQLVHVSRSEYRRRADSDYLASLQERYGPCHIIPEGGANSSGVAGSKAIARLVPTDGFREARIVLPAGTGTTLAGLAAGLRPDRQVVGISVLKGAFDLEQKVFAALNLSASENPARWQILHDYHCGGYARVSEELKAFMLAFERIHQVPLDPVYTAKALFAVHQLLRAGTWKGEVIFVHTGGLQGRRGFPWLGP